MQRTRNRHLPAAVFHCRTARPGLRFASAFPTDLLPRHTMSCQPLVPVLVRSLLLSLALAAADRPVRGQTPDVPKSEARYAVVVEKDIKVPVRDGIRLALDLYLPAAEGKPVPGRHPTILVRTPYNKN